VHAAPRQSSGVETFLNRHSVFGSVTTDLRTLGVEDASSIAKYMAVTAGVKFFVFEGIDGTGKSTVAQLVRKRLAERRDEEVVLTAEPTDSWLGDNVRRANAENINEFAETLLFLADRAQHTEQIRSWLRQGKMVLSDRYYASTLAYQSVSLKPLLGTRTLEWLRQVNEPIVIRPQITFLLKLDPEIALGRIVDRASKAKFERLDYLREVSAVYDRLAEKDRSFLVIDASEPLSAVVDAVVSLIESCP